MNLHNQIMNIRVNNKLKEDWTDVDGEVSGEWYAYKEGHRDARHSAAELSLKAEARIEELEEMLSRLVKENDLAMPNEKYQWMYSPMRVECLEILKEKM